jgi:hypothetical protein
MWLAEQLGALAGHFGSHAETESESRAAAELRADATSSLAQSEQWLRSVAENRPQPEEGGAIDLAGLAAHLDDVRGALHGAAESHMSAASAADQAASADGEHEHPLPTRAGTVPVLREAAAAQLAGLREALQAASDAEHDSSDALGGAVTAHVDSALESLREAAGTEQVQTPTSDRHNVVAQH